MKNSDKNSPNVVHNFININVYFRESKEKSGEGFIWIRFYINREKVNFSTKVKIREVFGIKKILGRKI